MNGVDVGQIVDKLADKLGVAVDKIQPLAEETVRQIVLRSWIWAGIAFLSVLGGIILFIATFKLWTKLANKYSEEHSRWEEADAMQIVLRLILSVAMSTVGIVEFANNIGSALAPIPTILGI